MTMMNISPPDSPKDFVGHQITTAGYGTSSECARELIRRDQDRLRLRHLLLEGIQSEATGVADAEFFDSLRSSVR